MRDLAILAAAILLVGAACWTSAQTAPVVTVAPPMGVEAARWLEGAALGLHALFWGLIWTLALAGLFWAEAEDEYLV